MPAKKLIVSTYLQYVLIGAVALLPIAFVRQLSGVLLSFLLAGVLAYVLNPLVRWPEGRGIPRVLAVLGVFVALVVLIVPAAGQVGTLVRNPQALIDGAAAMVDRIRELPYVGERVAALDQEALYEFARANAPSAGQVYNGAFGVFGTVLNLGLMLIISIYLVLDRERVTRAALGANLEAVRDQAVDLFHAGEGALVRYLKAQVLLCAIMGVLGWAIVFFTGGLSALLIGLWVAVTEIIPLLGAFLGAIPAVLIPLFAGNYLQALLVVAALFLVAQQIEGSVPVPRIVGGSTGVHPLWVLFATMTATALYGLVGAVFAFPIVAIIAAAFRYLRGTLLFERWHKAPVFALDAGETAERPTPEEGPTGEVPAVMDGGKSSPGTGGKGL